MRKIHLLFSLFAIVILSSASVLVYKNYIHLGSDAKTKKSEAEIANEAYLYRQSLLKNVNTGEVDLQDYYNAVKQAQAMRSAGSRGALGLAWEEMGPDNVGGRTRSICIDKNNSDHLFAGGVSGGLWESTNGGLNWTMVSSLRDLAGGAYLAISSIVQSGTTIYVGTGEPFNGTIPGNGVYKSTDNGATWSHLSATSIPTLLTPGQGFPWSVVSELAVSPTNPDHVFAALANAGLYESKDGGLSWAKPAAISLNTSAGCVKFGVDDNLVYAVIARNKLWRSNDGGTTWTNVTTSSNLSALSGYGSSSRVQVAIAPSDNNYVYLSGSNGCITGVFRTTDGGVTWTALLGAGSTTDPMAQPGGGAGCQGGYDDCIAVVPNDRTKIYIAGVTLFSYSDGLSWKRSDQIGSEGAGYASPHYIHADKHVIVFDPNNPEVMYVGQDGGVAKTSNANSGFPTPTFSSVDKDYRVTQFYGVAANYEGWMMAGAQDNGTRLLNYKGSTPRTSVEARSGDGFQSDMSRLNSNIMFGSIYYSNIARSGNKGVSFGGFFDSKIDPDGSGEPGTCTQCSPFFTYGSLMETKTATNSIKRSIFKNNAVPAATIPSGTTVQVLSNTGVTFPHTLTSDLNSGDSLILTDIYEAKYFFQTSIAATPGCGAWVCINPLNITQNPKWFKLPIPQQMQASDFSSDGNTAYIGCNGTLYRITGLNTATYNYTTGVITGLTTTTCSLAGPSTSIGGISVDPTDENHVVIARTGYGSTANVLHSTNGSTFTNVTGDLPTMPTYDVVIDPLNNNNYIVASELGIWTTSNRGTNWVEENNGTAGNEIGWIPVYRIRHVPLFDENCPVLYIGTHGRGMWRSTSLTPASCQTKVGINEVNTGFIATKSLQVYPNPTSDKATVSMVLTESNKLEVNIVSMTGKLVSTQTVDGIEGKNEFSINLNDLAAGSYIVSVKAGSKETVSKVIIKK